MRDEMHGPERRVDVWGGGASGAQAEDPAGG